MFLMDWERGTQFLITLRMIAIVGSLLILRKTKNWQMTTSQISIISIAKMQ
jgi:hypothetical protein